MNTDQSIDEVCRLLPYRDRVTDPEAYNKKIAILRNLFEQFDKVLEILRTKYIRLMVKGYKDWVRIEEFEYPEDVIREAIVLIFGRVRF